MSASSKTSSNLILNEITGELYDGKNSNIIKFLKKINRFPAILKIDDLPKRKLIYIKIFKETIPKYPPLTDELDELVISECVKMLIGKFIFNSPSKTDTVIRAHDLSVFLRSNLVRILQLKDFLIEKTKAKFEQSSSAQEGTGTAVPGEKVAQVTCPYKKLKTIFHTTIFDGETFLNIGHDFMHKEIIPNTIKISDIMHWPHTALTVKFPNFQVIRKNVHYSKYKLIKLHHDYKPNLKFRSLNLKFNPAIKSVSFSSYFILQYITQLITTVQSSKFISTTRRTQMLTVLLELREDFGLCTDGIDTATDYYIPLWGYPYVRYLGQMQDSESGQYPVNFTDQLKMAAEPELRLQEITYPIVMFHLKEFNVGYNSSENIKYAFPLQENYIKSHMWLTLSCTLCDVHYQGLLATYSMAYHLYNIHGPEPDWFCYVCNTSFSTENLSNKRWKHVCIPSPE